jgi:AraC-like DNA-binding protein
MSKKVINSFTPGDLQLNILEDVLNTIRFRGSVFFRSKLAAPWGFSFDMTDSPRFHIALRGDFFIGSQQSKGIHIQDMDIALVPHGDLHWIADEENRKLTQSSDASAACSIGAPLFQEGEITNKLICGIIHHEKDLLHPIIDSLPDILHFKKIEPDDPIWVLVLYIDSIMKGQYSNQSSIIDRLTEALFLQLLYKHLNENNLETGFFAALKNHKIYKVLDLFHKYPHIQWSLEEIGKQVGMSRSTIMRHFKSALNTTPMAYFNSWRMMRAYNLTKHSSKALEQIAEIVGFSSARTLNKAFQNHFGYTPNSLRRN